MFDFTTFDWTDFLTNIGANPFIAMWFLFIHGGWIVFLIIFVWCAILLRKDYKQHQFNHHKQFIVLRVSVPRMHEQSPRAVENMFAFCAGAHSGNSWTEEWIIGRTQDTLSFEIVSIEGNVQFIIRTTKAMRDLVEVAIFSQYPDADIVQIEDYVKLVPHKFPDEEWNLWGTQFKLTKPDFYPLRTYPMFEDKVSGEFKDPISAMLEALSHLGPGEHAWFQIILLPIGQGHFQHESEDLVKKLTGQEVHHHRHWALDVVEFPINLVLTIVKELLGGLFGHGEPAKHTSSDKKEKSNMMHMTSGEKDIVTAIENKASKTVFGVSMRFIYVAKKTVMSTSRIANSFMGSLRQINTNNMQTLKPEFAKIGTNGALWWFKQARNDARRTKLIHAYSDRSMHHGVKEFHLCSEELATLWHFPHSEQVKPPQLQKTQNKKAEPPGYIPFG